ncbi:MAG: BON domain-containing protein [Bdellovibrionales bacterium]
MRKAITIVFIAFIPLIILGLFQYSKQATHNIEQDIMASVDQALMRDGFSGQYGETILVTIDGRDVHLDGEAPNQSIQTAIEETVRSVYGVRKVRNNMIIAQTKDIKEETVSVDTKATTEQKEPSLPEEREQDKEQEKGLSLSTALSDTPIDTPTDTPKEEKTSNSILKKTVIIDTISCDPEVCDAAKKSQEQKSMATEPMIEEHQ